MWNEVPRDLPYTDEHLMNFIRTNVANKDDIVVDTPWLQVTQEGMSTLFGGKWIMDMVIDLVGLRLTLERPSLVYFPTIIKDVVPKNSFQSQYIKLQYLPKSLTKAKLAFFPYCVDREHWFACVSDFVKKTNFILDSNLPRRPDTRCKFLVETLFPALEIIARDFPGYKKLLQINNFPFVTVDVPRQKNGYSCGVYLLKFLENLSCQSLWSDQTCYENLDEYGESKIVDLIRWEENKRTDYT
ncbi:ubiquitin-like-specific protease 1 [Silene latifolia]|uniref:ubiquitin-like-specific protease 1 n=1 Tax=Silene latifolia TaxID=37657 RepID=UPI003D7762AD